jgi:uncharacterized protein involved in tolerance to divalent cations
MEEVLCRRLFDSLVSIFVWNQNIQGREEEAEFPLNLF